MNYLNKRIQEIKKESYPELSNAQIFGRYNPSDYQKNNNFLIDIETENIKRDSSIIGDAKIILNNSIMEWETYLDENTKDHYTAFISLGLSAIVLNEKEQGKVIEDDVIKRGYGAQLLECVEGIEDAIDEVPVIKMINTGYTALELEDILANSQ